MSLTIQETNSVSEQYFGHIRNTSDERSFKLDAEFLASYSKKKPNFGFNGLGEFVFYRTYSRVKEDGKKESFLDTLRRVVEGCYEIQRRHCSKIHIPWDYDKAQRSAQEMFERMWNFKFLPPGRGLWMMGTDFMWERGSAALNNCAFVSTDDRIESDPAEPFCFLMDMSMLGVGVGFDTKGAGKIAVHKPTGECVHVVYDSREGWVDSVRTLIWSYTKNPNMGRVRFDYSGIRKAGSDIKGFGGKASGPEILRDLHELMRDHFEKRIGTTLSSVDITDLMNYIGRCVVAGNVRRTAEIAFGEPNDEQYCSMKNPLATLLESDHSAFYNATGKIYARGSSTATIEDFIGDDGVLSIPEDRLKPAIDTWNALNHHRWASNNSIFAYIGMDYKFVGQQIASNGEPGLMWLDNMRDYGRMIDGRQPGIDGRVKGGNPCFTGDMRLLTEQGYVSMYDLWLAGGSQEYNGTDDAINKYGSQKIVNANGVVVASNVYRTGIDVPVFRVTLSDGSHIDATANHTMIKLVYDNGKLIEKRCQLNSLQTGDMIPLNTTSCLNSELSRSLATEIETNRSFRLHNGQLVLLSKSFSCELAESMKYLSHHKLLLNQLGVVSEIKGDVHLSTVDLVITRFDHMVKFIQALGYQNHPVAEHILEIAHGLTHSTFAKWLKHGLEETSDLQGYYFAKATSVDPIGSQDTYCLTEPGDNRVVVEGYQVGQCLEQSLESYELCVSGDTMLQLRNGARKISDLVGEKVEVWNGDDWSEVVPRVTGENRKLYRVHLSDGSYLDTTANHGWSVKPAGKKIYRRVETKDLIPGSKVLCFSLGDISGRHEPHAFEMGYIAGDGYRDTLDRPEYAKSMAVVCGGDDNRSKLALSGTQYKPQNKEGYSQEYTRYNLTSCVSVQQTAELRSKNSPIPEWIFELDRDSILQFVAGWIESDGSIARQPYTDGYRIYGTEDHMRSMQLLLRRIGINHSSVNFCHPKGQITNKGVRKYDLWYVQIPSFESGEIPTRHKVATKIGSRARPNPRYPDRLIDCAKKQKAIRIEELPGLHTTYCFDEPDNHMGVFGNSITYQCNLVETFPNNHSDAQDYMRTLKFAYLYAKTVTLLPTHNPRTNQVTLRNRRIGLSQSGIAQAFAKFGRRRMLFDFCDAGYNEIRRWDSIYSEWLCVQKSIKVTSVKPSGTVSLVAGATPGIHYPEASTYWRRVRLAKDSPLVGILSKAGFHIEPDVKDQDRTVVVRFGVSDERVRPVAHVSIWEQMANVVDYQRYWADNQVSCTVKFKPQDADQIYRVLEAFEDQLKGISFLPLYDHGYAQAPYEACTAAEVIEYNSKIGETDYSDFIGQEAEGSKFCDSDKCVIA